jgi:hypothetical protein
MSSSWVNESQISDTIHSQRSVWSDVCILSESKNFLQNGVHYESNRNSRKDRRGRRHSDVRTGGFRRCTEQASGAGSDEYHGDRDGRCRCGTWIGHRAMDAGKGAERRVHKVPSHRSLLVQGAAIGRARDTLEQSGHLRRPTVPRVGDLQMR